MLLAVVGLLLGIGSQPARAADTLQVAVNASTPEQGVPLTLEFSGTSEAIDTSGDGPELFAVVRPAGGIGCQANYANDHSAAGGVTYAIFGPEAPSFSEPAQGPGPYRQAATYNPPSIGSYLVCAWLEANGEKNTTVAGPASVTFDTRGPQVYQLSVGLPAAALPNIPFQVAYTTHTDQQLSMYSAIRPAGGLPCAANHELDSQQNQNETGLFGSTYFLESEHVFGGPTTIAGTATEAAGPYVICTWIEGPTNSEIDATATTPIYVGTPPPPPRVFHRASARLSLRSVHVSRRHGTVIVGVGAARLTGRVTAAVSCGPSRSFGAGRVIHGRFGLRLRTPRGCRRGGRARVTVRWPGSHNFSSQSVSDTVRVAP